MTSVTIDEGTTDTMERTNLSLPLFRILLSFAVYCGTVLGLWHGFAMAQVVVGTPQAEDDIANSVFLPAERSERLRLETAAELLKQERYSDAVVDLAYILSEAKEDYFFRPEGKGQTFRSLKSEARRMIGDAPVAARESFELQYGTKARRMLDEATEAGDVNNVAEVARRYFHTEAGYQAMVLLGRHHLDHGRTLAAALCFQHVYDTSAATDFEPALSLMLATCWARCDQPAAAREVLVKLHDQIGAGTVKIAGEEVSLFKNKEQALQWLADAAGEPTELLAGTTIDWIMFRGDPSRTAPSNGGRPLLTRPRWTQRVTYDPEIETMLAERQQQLLSNGMDALPSLHPLAVHNVVLMRTPESLAAFDFTTGKMIWHVGSEDDFEQDPSIQQRSRENHKQEKLFKRMYTDATYGTLASDGELVFVVESSSDSISVDRFGRRHLTTAGGQSTLAAYDIWRSEGKRKWAVGGPNGSVPELERAIFLGPPLPLQGELYAIAEIDSGIQLVVLEASTGELLWRQQLAVVQRLPQFDEFRRSGGATPSFAEGVLVCPTSAGAVVAVDLTTRALLWGYQYNDIADPRMRIVPGFGQIRRDPSGQTKTGSWADSSISISGGKVVITPTESDEIHCLNLSDGKKLWSKQRDENLYVACIHGNRAVVVGRTSISAQQLDESGKVAWGPIQLPDGGAVSGRGFYADDHYFLPIMGANGGEVIKIALANGKIVERARSHDGAPPGNLICYRGEIISQGIDKLKTFYQLDTLESRVASSLDNDQQDPWALARKGEILIERGKYGTAIPLFRASYKRYEEQLAQGEAGNDRLLATEARAGMLEARDMLVKSVMAGLRDDFAASRESAAEIENLLTDPVERMEYRKIMAEGLEKAGETAKALEMYLRLADEAGPIDGLERLDVTHSVRLDRWIRTRLAGMRDQLDSEQRDEFDRQVSERMEQILETGSPDEVRRFLNFFGANVTTAPLKLRLASMLRGRDTLLERDYLLRDVLAGDDVQWQNEALARIALLMVEAGREDMAVHYFRRIEAELADAQILDGQTGRELLEALPADGEVRRRLDRSRSWPVGVVDVAQGDTPESRNVSYQRTFGLRVYGQRDPLLADNTVLVDQQRQQSVVGLDDEGKHRWTVSLQNSGNYRGYFFNPSLSYARGDGHLLLLASGYQVVAIDTLRARPDGTDEDAIVWSDDVAQVIPGVPHTQVIIQRGFTGPRNLVNSARQQYGSPISQIGPVTDNGVCYIRNRELSCVNPITGDRYWVRRDIPAGGELFGDEEVLLIVERNNDKAIVIRAADGHVLARNHPVPNVNERWLTVGRNILTAQQRSDGWRIRLIDPWNADGEEEVLWERQYDQNCKADLIEEDAIGVMERDGHFQLIDIATGKVTIDAQLEQEPSLMGIYVQRCDDRYLLITNQPPQRRDPTRNYQPAPGGYDNPLINGRVYAFSRTGGEKLWHVPAEIDNFGLMLKQPHELPVLVFSRHIVEPRKGVRETSLLFLDKRTGQFVTDEKTYTFRTSNLEVVGDSTNQTVSVLVPGSGNTVTLSFTGKPIPPGPPGNSL
ncbi:MAG: PQQ-binding-like beta-propeller repeat protein, partial [Pirellulales bacterium]